MVLMMSSIPPISSDKYKHGVQKPRGLDNAAIQRNKHRGRPADVVETKEAKLENLPYDTSGNDAILAGTNTKIKINSQVGIDNGNDTLIVGSGADVKINSHATVDDADERHITPAEVKVKISRYEAYLGLTGSGDSRNDLDGDGLDNMEERKRGSHPLIPDTDWDGVSDRRDRHPRDVTKS